MDIKKRLGVNIKNLRTLQNISQEKLALKAGIDRTYLPSIEKGKRNVSVEVLEKLALALNIDIIELFKKQ